MSLRVVCDGTRTRGSRERRGRPRSPRRCSHRTCGASGPRSGWCIGYREPGGPVSPRSGLDCRLDGRSTTQPSTSKTQELQLPTDHGQKLNGFGDLANFLWSVADLLRGDYKQADYGKVILPMTVLRRLDCVLEPTKAEGPREVRAGEGRQGRQNLDAILNRITGVPFYNMSKLDFEKLKGDPNNIAHEPARLHQGLLRRTPATSSSSASSSPTRSTKLDESNLLYQVVCRGSRRSTCTPSAVPNHTMGYVFEELIRRFAEQSNETAGEHFTPREVIRLMVNLLFIEDDDALSKPGVVRIALRPRLRHRRHALGGGGVPARAEPATRAWRSSGRS